MNLELFSVQVPALDTIYSEKAVSSDIQWKLLAFIMSLDDDIISAIKAIPSEFRVICMTLYALVKVSGYFRKFSFE